MMSAHLLTSWTTISLQPPRNTERRGRVVSTNASHSGGPDFKTWPGNRLA